MWKESNIKVNGKVFHYWMKQYEAGSHWGIAVSYTHLRAHET